MSTISHFPVQTPAQYQRPPWPAAVAALLAYLALAGSSGAVVPLGVLGVGLAASYLAPARYENETLTKWTLRIIVVGLSVFAYLITAVKDENAFIDVRYLNSFALAAAAELALQFWRREPTGGARAPFTVFLSAMIYLIGCGTPDDASHFLWYLTPTFFLFFALALQSFRQPARSALPLLPTLLPLLAALAVGSLAWVSVARYKNELNLLGSQVLPGRRLSPSMGMSGQPILGSSFTLRDSFTRVLRVENLGPDHYLRGTAFDTYTGRSWGPSLDDRRFLALPPQASRQGEPPERFVRLDDSLGLLFVPLHSAAILPEGGHPVDWAAQNGGTLRTPPADTDSLIYDVREGPGGLLDRPPTAGELNADTFAPAEVAPRVYTLARQITADKKTAAGKIAAVVEYLQVHNAYSLTVDHGPGEPISNFILEHKAAHCEYFASAAAVMLRAAGVPTRYVSGYYAHESDGPRRTLVRQRDAHAWAESWIAGTGWVTVDASPGGGRPDALSGPIPFYWRLWEGAQDILGELRAWVISASWGEKGLVFALLVLGLLVPQIVRYRQRQRQRSAGFLYTSTDAALTRISARFETLLARRGLPCPPALTWPEHLAATALGQDREMQRFVRRYSRARFGAEPGREEIAQIEETLQVMEKQK